MATAILVSRFVALILGESAVIAVTPQIEVPAERRLPSLGDKPALRLAQGMNVSPAAILAMTTGIPVLPVDRISSSDNFNPTHTIPVRNIVVLLNFSPGANIDSLLIIFGRRLLATIPKRIAEEEKKKDN